MTRFRRWFFFVVFLGTFLVTVQKGTREIRHGRPLKNFVTEWPRAHFCGTALVARDTRSVRGRVKDLNALIPTTNNQVFQSSLPLA